MSGVIGFDFGTTNSLISFVRGRQVTNLLEDGLPHPSVVCYQGDMKIVGRKAKERLTLAGLGVMGNIVRSPKTLLGEHKVYVEGVARSPKDIVADIVSYVRERALHSNLVEGFDGKFDKAVVTIPVDMNGQRRKELRDAFRMAGIAISQFVHEPLAALYGHLRTRDDFAESLRKLNRELVLVFDWGGGTLDLTLCRVVDGMLVQIKNDGCNKIGGDCVDENIRNVVIQRALEKRGITERLPIQPGGLERLLTLAERAKIELSTKEKTLIYVTDFFQTQAADPDLEYELTREELEEICEREVTEGIDRVQNLLASSRSNPASVALCLATGGMVNMPVIKSRLQEIFGPQRLEVSERGGTIIAEGAAWIAHDEKRLSLAKNLELYVAVDSHFPLVKAGTLMPREGVVQKETFNLYCTDPRDGIAKFQIKCPHKGGRQVQSTDTRRILDHLSIKVDPAARPFFERLQLDLEIDDNLIVRTTARSSIAKDRDSVEIHNIEFGLALPSMLETSVNASEDRQELDGENTEKRNEGGIVTIRSNISHCDDKSLVPGELMAEIEPSYIYHGNNPPKRQLDESNYYLPCSQCHRAWNDPECRCGQRDDEFEDIKI